SKYLTEVENFGQVKVENLYSGIDATFTVTSDGKLEYSFIVHAGADPGQIQLQFQGADSVSVDQAGNLVLHTAAGDVTESAPLFSQQSQDGAAPQPTITGGYVVNQDNTVGIQVTGYDNTQDLT